MKKILLLLTFLLSINKSFSQEFYIGKTLTELTPDINIIKNKQYLNIKIVSIIIDTNEMDILHFNNDVCIFYEKILKKELFDNFQNILSNFWYKMNDSLYTDNYGFLAEILPQPNENLYKIQIGKK